MNLDLRLMTAKTAQAVDCARVDEKTPRQKSETKVRKERGVGTALSYPWDNLYVFDTT
jgi:hypothetical protein